MHVLVIDDDRSMREGCATVVQAEGHIVTSSARGDEALELIGRRAFDLVFLDLFMTPVSGMELLREIRRMHPECLVVIITGNASVETNIAALEAGAWEYIPKPFSATQLQMLLGRAAHSLHSRTDRPVVNEVASAAATAVAGNGKVLGVSPAMKGALALATKVAPTDASVIIVGESGTGKEVIARYIHAHSRRAKHTLMPVNCAALPEPLLESEMFGHRRGAFTGAERDKPGLLETAHRGTLFLDELTEMSRAIQAKLLRVLQDGRLRRVGSEEEDREVDVRIICATNSDPQRAVREGILRQDLFFRLWVFPIFVPPLRERPEDIVHLSTVFLAQYWTRHRGTRARPPVLSQQAVDDLVRRPWTGNVRELQNTMERLAVTADPGEEIHPASIPSIGDTLLTQSLARTDATVVSSMSGTFHSAREEVLTSFERMYLKSLVQRAEHNLSRAARIAGIDRTTLYRLLEKHGLKRSDFIDAEA